MTESKRAPKKKFDWHTIEVDWRAGIKSVLQLSKDYGVSRAAIIKHWAKEGIDRDLTDKIKSAVDIEANKRIAASKMEGYSQVTPATNSRLSDEDIVKGVARAVADVDSRHKKRLDTLSNLADVLVAELSALSVNVDDFTNIGEMLRNENDSGMDKINDLYKKVISFPGRTSSMKQLADTVKIIVELERKVYKLDTDSSGASKNIEDLLNGLK